MELTDKYQIEESNEKFSFRPFYYYKKGTLWYILGILILGGLCFYFYNQMSDALKIIGFGAILIALFYLIKESLIYIPIQYTFDVAENAVYKSNLFVKNRKILKLDEVVIFQSSEMGSWQYAMGAKKSQFVKNYKISESFSDKKNNKKLIAYETEILDKLELLILNSIKK